MNFGTYKQLWMVNFGGTLYEVTTLTEATYNIKDISRL